MLTLCFTFLSDALKFLQFGSPYYIDCRTACKLKASYLYLANHHHRNHLTLPHFLTHTHNLIHFSSEKKSGRLLLDSFCSISTRKHIDIIQNQTPTCGCGSIDKTITNTLHFIDLFWKDSVLKLWRDLGSIKLKIKAEEITKTQMNIRNILQVLPAHHQKFVIKLVKSFSELIAHCLEVESHQKHLSCLGNQLKTKLLQ